MKTFSLDPIIIGDGLNLTHSLTAIVVKINRHDGCSYVVFSTHRHKEICLDEHSGRSLGLQRGDKIQLVPRTEGGYFLRKPDV